MNTNRRAEEFDRALSGTGPVDPTMAALVAVAGALAAVPQRPAPAFRETLRAQLVSEAASLSASTAASVGAAAGGAPVAGGLRAVLSKPAMQVASGTLAATVAATGVGVGASRSLPGDALYGLKRTVERWQVGLAGESLNEAEALLEHADTRLDEVRALLAQGDLDELTGVLEELRDELDSATSRLLDAAREGSRGAYDRLSEAVLDLNRRILALLPSLPADARAAASEAMSTLNVAQARLATLPVPPLPGTTPTPGITTPPPVTTTPPPTTAPPTSKPPTLPTDVPTTIPTGVPTTILPPSPTLTVPPLPTVTVPPVTIPPL